MKEEKVIVDESFVLKFEDSTQPAKRIKQEPTVSDLEESKVFVDAKTQTEVFDAILRYENSTQTDPEESKVFVDWATQTFDADLKVERATQTDWPIDWPNAITALWPIIYSCRLCRQKRFWSSEQLVSANMKFL